MTTHHFPTPEHEQAAQTVINIFKAHNEVHAISLVNLLIKQYVE